MANLEVHLSTKMEKLWANLESPKTLLKGKKTGEALSETVNRVLRQQAAIVALAKEKFSDFELQ